MEKWSLVFYNNVCNVSTGITSMILVRILYGKWKYAGTLSTYVCVKQTLKCIFLETIVTLFILCHVFSWTEMGPTLVILETVL